MNRKYIGWGLVLAAVFWGMLSGCSDSEEPEVPGQEENKSAVVEKLNSGVWIASSKDYSWGTKPTPWFETDKDIVRLFFFDDGHGVMLTKQYSYDYTGGGLSTGSSKEWFEYSETPGNNVRLTFFDRDMPRMELTVSENGLSDADGVVFKFQSFQKDETDFLKVYAPRKGMCGESATYSYEPWEGMLRITGQGKMSDYSRASGQPWADCQRNIAYLNVEGDISGIGNHAFENLPYLSEVEFRSKSVVSIGDYAFAGCHELKIFPYLNDIEYIGSSAFEDCKSMSCYFQDNDLSSLTEIGSNAFRGIKKTSLSDVVFGSNCRKIGTYAFGENAMSTVAFEEGVVEMSSCDEAADGALFTLRGSNQKLTLPSSLEILGISSFYGDINEIHLGSGLRRIGEAAIITSRKSGDIYVSASEPPSVDGAFVVDEKTHSSVHSSWTLHVPAESADKYRSAEGWRNFKKVVADGSGDAGEDGELLSSLVVTPSAFSAEVSGTVSAETFSQSKSIEFRYGKSYGLSEYSNVTITDRIFSFSLPYLDSDSQYYYRVVVKDKNGHTSSSEIKSMTTLSPRVPSSCEYSIDGTTFKMIKVSGMPGGDFFMMETELPPTSTFVVDGYTASQLDVNLDNVVIKAEFRRFLTELRMATGIAFRLPTKEEWMYAAKGGNLGNGYKYSGSDDLEEVGWFKENSSSKKHSPASLMPNELGLYDMSGNYGEIVNDNQTDVFYVDGDVYGGWYISKASGCTVRSYVKQPTGGKVEGTNKSENNAFNAKYYTVRLVYSAK